MVQPPLLVHRLERRHPLALALLVQAVVHEPQPPLALPDPLLVHVVDERHQRRFQGDVLPDHVPGLPLVEHGEALLQPGGGAHGLVQHLGHDVEPPVAVVDLDHRDDRRVVALARLRAGGVRQQDGLGRDLPLALQPADVVHRVGVLEPLPLERLIGGRGPEDDLAAELVVVGARLRVHAHQGLPLREQRPAGRGRDATGDHAAVGGVFEQVGGEVVVGEARADEHDLAGVLVRQQVLELGQRVPDLGHDLRARDALLVPEVVADQDVVVLAGLGRQAAGRGERRLRAFAGLRGRGPLLVAPLLSHRLRHVLREQRLDPEAAGVERVALGVSRRVGLV